MGNTQSQGKKSDKEEDMYFNKELLDSIDLLASKLIFEQSFQNLKKLEDPRYCNEVSVLTQQLLKKKLDPVTVNVVSTRIKYGTTNLYVIDDDGYKQLKKVDYKGDKNALCLNVSRFYTRIFQAYSAIVSAINPVYVYRDIEGTEKVSSVFDEISSENKSKADIGLRSLCSRRIYYLKPRKMGEKQMSLKMKNCGMNKKSQPIPILTREHVDKHKKKEKTDIEVEKKEDNEEKETESEEKKEEVESDKKEEEKDVKQEEKKEDTEEEKKEEGESQEKDAEQHEKKEEGESKEKKEDKQVGGNSDVVDENKPVVKEENNIEEKGEVKMTSDILNTMTLADEPGIQSLENLYKDVMKIETVGKQLKGVFVMSDKSKKQYKKDLMEFYKAFVPNGESRNNIEKFSDIKLTDFTKTKECNDKNDDSVNVKWGKGIMGDSSKKEDSLFVKYGNHFQSMIKNVKERENELLGLLQQLFEFDLNKPVPIKIKSDLTEDKLNNEIMGNIKKTIKKMYIGCETDFQRGIQIYNEIYKQRNNM